MKQQAELTHTRQSHQWRELDGNGPDPPQGHGHQEGWRPCSHRLAGKAAAQQGVQKGFTADVK